MPRLPKPPELRQRRNKATTRAMLPAEGTPRTKATKVPPLPRRKGGWAPEARAAWGRYWRSPMATELLTADYDRALLYTDLVDLYWRVRRGADGPSLPSIAAEIRLQGMGLGATPLDRRRLEWEIFRDPQEGERRPPETARPAQPAPAEDPRKVLAMPPRSA